MRDFEVVVVHDGPSHRAFPTARPNVRFEVIPKRGLSAAVNHAFQVSRGQYLTVLADDDLILPHKLATLAAALDAQPEADVVYSLPQYADKSGNPTNTPGSVIAWMEKHQWMRWENIMVDDGLLIHGTATMYRRETWEMCGEWDEALQRCEEWEWHLRLLYHGAWFRAVDSVTDLYRQHQGQKGRKDNRAGVHGRARARVREKLNRWKETTREGKRVPLLSHSTV